MTENDTRKVLDGLNVPVDDPLRSLAADFASRPPSEQNLWLFIEVTRMKPSKTPQRLNAAYTTVVAVFLGAIQLLARVGG